MGQKSINLKNLAKENSDLTEHISKTEEKNNENNYDWIKYEEMKNIDSYFFEKWDKKVRQLNRKDLKTFNAKWFYLLDSQRKKIYFNDISPSSRTLDLIDNVDREVEYLSKYITENIIEKLFNN